jgi:hypothetical protein
MFLGSDLVTFTSYVERMVHYQRSEASAAISYEVMGFPIWTFPSANIMSVSIAWQLGLRVKKCFVVVERFFSVALYIVVIVLRVRFKLRERMYYNQLHSPRRKFQFTAPAHRQ